MSVVMSVFYPLWYKAHRSRIKEILQTDTIAAKNLLDEITTEHDIISDEDENSHLHHAQDHLDAFQDSEQIEQKEATERALDE